HRPAQDVRVVRAQNSVRRHSAGRERLGQRRAWSAVAAGRKQTSLADEEAPVGREAQRHPRSLVAEGRGWRSEAIAEARLREGIGRVPAMQFTKRLREPVMRGEVTCSVRIWQRPHVKAGGFYAMGPGAIEVTSVKKIGLEDITPALA